MVWLDGENTVSSCRAGTECGGDDSPCFVDVAFGACLLFGCLPVRCVSRYYFLGFGKGKEESFPLLACFVVVALWGIGGVYRRFGSRGSFIDGIDCSLQCIRPYHSNLLTPLYQWGNNVLALWAERVDSYAFYSVDVWMKGLSTFVVAVGTVIVLFILAWRGGRTYCNTICPVGTVLGLLSRYSYFKPVIDTSKCNGCGLCARNCKSSCINPKAHEIDYSRCVACMDCLGKCRQDAIKYVSGAIIQKKQVLRREETGQSASQSSSNSEKVNTSRRNFFTVSALLATSAVMKAQEKKVDGGLAPLIDKKNPKRATSIVPAGARGLRHFAQHCTACQLCVSVCPNQILRPSGDLKRLMQPEMSYERGYCRPECAKCAEVCPTDAIHLTSLAEKSAIQIGHAVWIAQNCIVNTDKVSCGNCARHCPTGAIQMIPKDENDESSPKIPVVNTERCIGCGACENLCPARPFSAIYVEGHEMHRVI